MDPAKIRKMVETGEAVSLSQAKRMLIMGTSSLSACTCSHLRNQHRFKFGFVQECHECGCQEYRKG